MTQPVRHFLDLWRMDGATLRAILDDAHARKAARKAASKAKHVRKVFDSKAGKLLPTPVYWRFDLSAGATLKGPAIIAEHETSTLVASGFTARIDTAGYIHLERNA